MIDICKVEDDDVVLSYTVRFPEGVVWNRK